MSISQNFQDILPSLNLNFADAQALDPRVSFSRASTGTYVGPNGLIQTAGVNVPRFTYDPVTGKSLGLLVEDATTNLLTYSNGFDNAIWAKSGTSVTPNAAIAPDGNNTAYKLIASATTASHSISVGPNTISNKIYTFSVFAKAAEYSSITIGNVFGGVPASATFDLNTGNYTVNQNVFNAILFATYAIKFPNNWWRISITTTLIGYNGYTFIYPNTSSSFTGDSTSGVYIWGAQLEQSSLLTSYIPTSGSTITRAADIANIIGSNFSNFYNTSGGSISISATNYNYLNQNNINLVTLNDGTTNNYTSLNIPTTYSGIQLTSVSSGVTQSNINISAYPYDASSITSTFTNNNFGINLNSVGIASTSSGSVPSVTQMLIGTGITSYQNFNGIIKSLSYYPNTFNNTSLNSNSIVASGTGTTISPANNQYEFMIRVGAGTTYTLLTNNSGTYNYNVNWGDGTVTNGINTNNPTKVYANAGVYRIIVTQNSGSFYFLNGGDGKLGPFILSIIGTGSSFSWNNNFASAWNSCSNLISFPQINTSSGTNFNYAWVDCFSLTSFPLLNTSNGTSFLGTWQNCSSLTSFPQINVSKGTSFGSTWYLCSSLTSFPSITFGGAGATNPTFVSAWYGCTKLSSFPSGAFNACTGSTNYTSAWNGCALTATSIENILTSIVSSGATINTPVTGNIDLSGGTNATKSTWTTNALNAYNTLVGAGWTISYRP